MKEFQLIVKNQIVVIDFKKSSPTSQICKQYRGDLPIKVQPMTYLTL